MAYCEDDYFKVFGNITVYFATLDFLVSELIMRLLPTPPNAHQLKPPYNERSTLGQKLNILREMTAEHVVHPELLTRVQTILPEAIEVSEKRNRYMHDLWVFDPTMICKGEIGRLQIEITKGWLPSFKNNHHTIAELNEFLKILGRQQKTFGGFLNELPQRTFIK